MHWAKTNYVKKYMEKLPIIIHPRLVKNNRLCSTYNMQLKMFSLQQLNSFDSCCVVLCLFMFCTDLFISRFISCLLTCPAVHVCHDAPLIRNILAAVLCDSEHTCCCPVWFRTYSVDSFNCAFNVVHLHRISIIIYRLLYYCCHCHIL